MYFHTRDIKRALEDLIQKELDGQDQEDALILLDALGDPRQEYAAVYPTAAELIKPQCEVIEEFEIEGVPSRKLIRALGAHRVTWTETGWDLNNNVTDFEVKGRLPEVRAVRSAVETLFGGSS